MSAETQPHLDSAIADIATRQHGVVSRDQLVALGITRHGISWRIRTGRLHRIHRGVYAVGHRRLTRNGRYMAAVLAGGKEAVLSHRAAATLWRIRPGDAKAEITIPRAKPSTTAITYHRSCLPADEITTLDGIPVTTVARTLLDLGALVDSHQLERAFNEAEYRRLWDAVGLPALLRRYPGNRGTAAIRAIIEDSSRQNGITKEQLEKRFLSFVDAFQLPRPALNEWLELEPGRWIQPDCMWREQRLIVELDSRAAHQTGSRFESDRARDRMLAVAGLRVVRVTWRQLDGDRQRLAADLRSLLCRAV